MCACVTLFAWDASNYILPGQMGRCFLWPSVKTVLTLFSVPWALSHAHKPLYCIYLCFYFMYIGLLTSYL